MRNDGHISNLEDLKRWFDLSQAGKEPKPYFTVWSGYEPVQKKLILRNEEVSDAEKSWDLLQEMIEIHSENSGGVFRVFLTSKPGYNIGVNTIVRIPGTIAANVAGINGVGAGTFGIYGSAKEMIEAEIERRMEVYELKREIEDMKAGNSAMNGVEQVRQIFEAVPALNPLAHALGMKLLGMTPAQVPPPPAQGVHVPGDGIQGSDTEGFDYDVVEPALDKLRRVFPNVEMTLDQLADWALQNPEMARNLFGNIKQPGA